MSNPHQRFLVCPFGTGQRFLVCVPWFPLTKRAYSRQALQSIGRRPVAVPSIVVRDSPVRIDIAHIVSVADVRGTQPPIAGLQPMT